MNDAIRQRNDIIAAPDTIIIAKIELLELVIVVFVVTEVSG